MTAPLTDSEYAEALDMVARALLHANAELAAARACVDELRIAVAHQTDITYQPGLRRAMTAALAAYDSAVAQMQAAK